MPTDHPADGTGYDGLPAAMKTFAARVPLVSTIWYDQLLEAGGRLPVPPPDDPASSRPVEQRCGLPPSRYYYAGRAHPRFGDCAFAFLPAIEEEHTGSANPFDTGGVFYGKSYPTAGIVDREAREARAQELIRATLVPLERWRQELASFLAAHFEAPTDYLGGVAPNPDAEWGPAELPAHHPKDLGAPGVEWRSWTWEIRLHEEHPVDRHLGAWSCTAAAEAAILNDATIGVATPLEAGDWRTRLPLPVASGPDFCSGLEAWVRAEVSR